MIAVTRTFDLVVSGGRVIDPAAGRDGVLDVAISGGRVAAVDRDIPAAAARSVIDARGLLVLPGLIDLHTHIFHGCTYWGIDPDRVAPDSGVTTWIDAGSAGALSLAGFEKYIVAATRLRVRSFLNVSSIGLIAPDFELARPEYLDMEFLERAFRNSAGTVIGIKVRMSSPTIGSTGLTALELAQEFARAHGLPVMVHISTEPPAVDDVLGLLKAGDIVTHCYTGGSMCMISDGVPKESLRAALDRGVVLDVGHGAGSYSFAVAESLLSNGIPPHTISTDLHQMSTYPDALQSNDATASPVIKFANSSVARLDLPLCMSKLLCAGMPLQGVVASVTSGPASILRTNEIGTLSVGARADIALMKQEEGNFRFTDVYGEERMGSVRLTNVGTLLDGNRLSDPREPADAPWVDIG